MPIDSDKNDDGKNQLNRLTDELREILENFSGIKVDSDIALRQALDTLLNDGVDKTEQRVRDIEARALKKLRKKSGPCCSLCGRSQIQVSQLFAGQNDLICDRCIGARI